MWQRQNTAGDGGVDDITLGSAASGRYVRMLGVARGTQYGYSLWEFEVYSDALSGKKRGHVLNINYLPA